jgi:hypothetical protein
MLLLKAGPGMGMMLIARASGHLVHPLSLLPLLLMFLLLLLVPLLPVEPAAGVAAVQAACTSRRTSAAAASTAVGLAPINTTVSAEKACALPALSTEAVLGAVSAAFAGFEPTACAILLQSSRVRCLVAGLPSGSTSPPYLSPEEMTDKVPLLLLLLLLDLRSVGSIPRMLPVVLRRPLAAGVAASAAAAAVVAPGTGAAGVGPAGLTRDSVSPRDPNTSSHCCSFGRYDVWR